MIYKEDWLGYLLSGLVAMVFGIIALVYQSAGFKSIAIIFCVFIVVKGIIDLAFSFKRENSLWQKFEGVIEIAVGALAFVSLGNNFLLDAGWSVILGIWAIVMGIAELFSAYQLRKMLQKDWIYWLTGIISIAFGLMILGDPLRAGFLPLNFLIGLYSVILGGALAFISFKIRKLPPANPNQKASK
ncbi:MAG: HdeD family acid-resistance protein [Pyrinomonadaceae bacterium]